MEENEELNIGPAIVGSEKNMIHQFIWAYKDGFSLRLRDLGSFKCHEIPIELTMIHPYSKILIDIMTCRCI
jgi:hypothetical protein